MTHPRLPFDDAPPAGPQGDAIDRAAAVDPRLNVVLEASAGTGKTRVLVDRYVNLLRAGVHPRNILAITFTRKAAAEMRERILATLRTAAERGEIDPARWRELADELGEVAISTIDAFCLSLLREFPLEADLDPGFDMADETEAARLMDEALDRAIRRCRALATGDAAVGLVFAQLGEWRVRQGLTGLLDRRLVAAEALGRAVRATPRELSPAQVAERFFSRLRATLGGVEGGIDRFLDSGPVRHPRYRMLAQDVRRLVLEPSPAPDRALEDVRLLADGLREYCFTKDGAPRQRWSPRYRRDDVRSPAGWTRHQELATRLAPRLREDLLAFARDLNAVLTRGVWRLFAVATEEYRRTLEQHAVVDFTDALARALALVGGMDEFAHSRFLLESRYHHLLVDEFQDTSDAQWQLIWRLVQSWGEGVGVGQDAPLEPTIFVVGDRKQSIYGFRDADPTVLARAAARIGELRPEGRVRRAIRRSFRAVPALLAFTNDLCDSLEQRRDRADAFTYTELDRFPVEEDRAAEEQSLGLIAAEDEAACARGVAAEIARLLQNGAVRDRQTGVRRATRPGDVSILFRTRDGHQVFEQALQAWGIPSYVYKGLGFFDADEIKDVTALLRYLARPVSNLRAAALLRSGIVRVSDAALSLLGPDLAGAVVREQPGEEALSAEDARVLATLRGSASRWLALVDRLPPADLVDLVLQESSYLYELAGPRHLQAIENLKKLRSLLRRLQNRGYATAGRIAEQIERLSAGDESNAAIDALDAVNLMTIHAAKGLEFPVVFLVNLSRGGGGRTAPIRFAGDEDDEAVVSIGDYRSAADEDAADREREETKRLLYVATTRARDRLYLSSALVKGEFRPAAGGLGEVLPPGLTDALAKAARRPGEVEWRTAGRVHRFQVCEAPASPPGRPVEPEPAPPAAVDLEPLAGGGTLPRRALAEDDPGETLARAAARNGTSSRLVGRLVHRLFEHEAPGDDPEALTRLAAALAPHDELSGADPGPAAAEAARRYLALRRHPALAALATSLARWHEVPVSLHAGDAIRRGKVDLLTEQPDGRLVAVELKTGVETEAHGRQLQQYVEAVRAAAPGRIVEGQLVYPPAE